jgi:hypothetical protein
MDEPQRWTCECGFSVAMTEEEMADLRVWLAHIRNAHGDDVLEALIQRELDRRIEELKREGKVLHDTFDGHDYFVEEYRLAPSQSPSGPPLTLSCATIA